ncbi:hypothetical protein ACTNDN_20630 [Niallia sp. HCP3S3_B10]|uniref:hypothetical protein n=1 Tax=Niallia sp. HCP3S3_B10 TaxID=3438944 RepID=UPI003F886B7F
MGHLLNCTNYESVFKSIKTILGVSHNSLIDFIKLNEYRIKLRRDFGYPIFERFEISEIKDYFNIDVFNYDEIIVHHAASLLENSTHLEQGIYNLKRLAETHNSFKLFLSNYGITYDTDRVGTPYFAYNGNKVTSPYLESRFKKDLCINGFLFSYSVLEDTNIKDLKYCPEIVAHLGREIGIDLRREWIEQSNPCSVSFKVKLREIDNSTLNTSVADNKAKQEYFIKLAIEYLIIDEVMIYQYPKDNPMVFLKEEIQISPERIVNIVPLSELESF